MYPLRDISEDKRLAVVIIVHKYLANVKHPIGFILTFPMPLTYRQHEGGSKFEVSCIPLESPQTVSFVLPR